MGTSVTFSETPNEISYLGTRGMLPLGNSAGNIAVISVTFGLGRTSERFGRDRTKFHRSRPLRTLSGGRNGRAGPRSGVIVTLHQQRLCGPGQHRLRKAPGWLEDDVSPADAAAAGRRRGEWQSHGGRQCQGKVSRPVRERSGKEQRLAVECLLQQSLIFAALHVDRSKMLQVLSRELGVKQGETALNEALDEMHQAYL